ncbi:diacylglycerol/lipid kinase family protein [Fusibacter ferrireducens]|uniref:Diacylglycerol kinase family lipid kinase n=1 Tax=Fusibacter ferrireducens TaxID=2785058 RepID=A0ABR9ZZN4_9FIRM|nr:diacylglycerol kinase family protein [Fusibacter ferrireducens]MBF4695446.1 diacylglycerol kinase family lipid kinase [Fusibacter ferrireducens]
MVKERNIIFIINPVAGRGKTIELLPTIKEKLDEMKNIKYSIQVSRYKGNITEIVKSYVQKGYDEFVGVGGDGTLSEIINGLDYTITKKFRVGIIPSGTGNDFVRCFDRATDMNSVLSRIRNEETIFVDIGRANQFYFINVCSFGIDGPIIKDTERLKKIIHGPVAYFLSTLKSGLFFKANRVWIKVDDHEVNKPLLLIAVGNGKYIGGGMNVCPEASPQDGEFDICLVNSVSKKVFIKELAKIYKGKLEALKEVKYLKGKEIEISDDKNQYYINADGTLVGKTPVKISIIEKAIEFF